VGNNVVNQWRLADFGPLDYAHSMHLAIPGATLVALGARTLLSSFFVSILGMRRLLDACQSAHARQPPKDTLRVEFEFCAASCYS
jgi:hypothetical protein